MKIAVIGTGYVGLVTAACFAELGNEVTACDIDAGKIERLKAGEITIYEPGLEEIAARNTKEGRLRFATDPAEAVSSAEAIFIAVGTPALGDSGEPDLQFIESAAGSVGENLGRPRQVVIMKSTVPVGTAVRVRDIIRARLRERGAEQDFAVVSNPEFLKEGDAIADFTHPDRIVIGAAEDWAREKMEELYRPITKPGHPIFFMDNASAEMTKYAANTFLASRISLMNEIASICEVVGADVEEVRRAIAADKRIGRHFLYPGVGYGGSCFPKDVIALAATARRSGASAELISAIDSVNNAQRMRFAQKISSAMGDLKGKKIAVWGLAFKPKTDDMRQAPSREIIGHLLEAGAEVAAYDPVAMDEARKIFGEKIVYAEDMYAALAGAHALVVVTEWAQFREPDLARVADLLADKTVFDGRNIYDPQRMRELGLRYYGIGRT